MSDGGISDDIKRELGFSEPDGVGRLDQHYDCFSGDTLCSGIERADCETKRYIIRQLTAEELRELEYRCREKVLQIETDLKTIRLHGNKSREKEKNTKTALERFKSCLKYIREQRRRVDRFSTDSETETARLFVEEAKEALSQEEFESIMLSAIDRQYEEPDPPKTEMEGGGDGHL